MLTSLYDHRKYGIFIVYERVECEWWTSDDVSGTKTSLSIFILKNMGILNKDSFNVIVSSYKRCHNNWSYLGISDP